MDVNECQDSLTADYCNNGYDFLCPLGFKVFGSSAG
jgi:hypothetical protein